MQIGLCILPCFRKVAWRQGRGAGLSGKGEEGVHWPFHHWENMQALNLANSLEAFFLLARATWILGPIS